MRVTLMHNPKAGAKQPDAKLLKKALAGAGYDVTYRSTKKTGYEEALEDPGDLVVVAGGDGTIRKIAQDLVGRGIPIAVLPLGTANNIARTLGIEGSPEELIAALGSARRKRFDVGITRGARVHSRFFEAVGTGLFAEAMFRAQTRAAADNAEQKHKGIARNIRLLAQVLREFQPRRWTVVADDVDLSGDYLLCEVMNVRSIGANLCLAPGADPGDGYLDMVLVGEAEREALGAYLAARLEGDHEPPELPVRRVRRVELHPVGADVHVDDEFERGRRLEIGLEPEGLHFLVPAGTSERPLGS